MGVTNGKFIVIGGAGDGRDDFDIVADEMIALTGKSEPSFLFIGFAQVEPFHGFEYYGALFAKKGCVCSLLTNCDIEIGGSAKAKIDSADMIFIMGGNTGKLLNTLRAHGIDEMLRGAAERGAVIAGFSAGAITICERGMSKNDDYTVEQGLGLLNFYCCPHPMTSKKRYALFLDDLRNHDEVGIAFDGAGLEVCEGKFRALIFCPDGYKASFLSYLDGRCIEHDVGSEWRPIDEIYK